MHIFFTASLVPKVAARNEMLFCSRESGRLVGVEV